MRSAFALDRWVSLFARVRAVLGIVLCATVMILCILGAFGYTPSWLRAASSPANSSSTTVRGQANPRPIAMEEERQKRRMTTRYTAFFLSLVGVGFCAFKYALATRIGRGEPRGFIGTAAVEALGAFLWMLILLSRPWAGVNVILALAVFLYCIARMSGTGPKPI